MSNNSQGYYNGMINEVRQFEQQEKLRLKGEIEKLEAENAELKRRISNLVYFFSNSLRAAEKLLHQSHALMFENIRLKRELEKGK